MNGSNASQFQSSLAKHLHIESGVDNMGRGCGGYTEIHANYKDSGGHKVKDIGTIFVAERYIDAGYESVFRQEHQPDKSFDLTIKTSDDVDFVKNIEVKRVTSENPSKISFRIAEGFEQFVPGQEGTVAIVLPNHKNDPKGISFAKVGFDEAKRKGFVIGEVEFWFSDKTKVVFK
jgi:hypothetical protein